MKKLGQGAITTGAGTLIYTVPTGCQTEVEDIVVANTTAAPITCALHFVPTGGSATTSNMMFPTVSIPGNTLVHWHGRQVLNSGDFVQGIGGASGLTVNVSGNEYRVKI